MATNWRLQSTLCKSVFDDFIAIGKPIPQEQKVNIICPHCQYHTAWKRAEDWINCGWCLEFVGNGADKRKAEADRRKEIKQLQGKTQ